MKFTKADTSFLAFRWNIWTSKLISVVYIEFVWLLARFFGHRMEFMTAETDFWCLYAEFMG